MAGTVTADILQSPALPFLVRLEAEGYELEADEEMLRVRPLARVTPRLRAELLRYKSELLALLECCDAGVQDRRQKFATQLDSAQTTALVPRLVFRDVPYAKGHCHACGELLDSMRWGSCWRCCLARRLACGAPIPAASSTVYDEAKVCA